MTENGNDAGEWERCRGRLGALSEAVLARETPTSPMIGSDTWTGNGGYDSGGSNSSDRSSWGGTSYGSGSAHIVHRSHSSHSELHGFARCDYTTVNGKDRVEEWMKFHSPLDGLVESGKGGRNGKLAESTKGDRDGNLVESGKCGRDRKPAESGKVGRDRKPAESGNGGRDGNLMESGKGGTGGNLVETGKGGRDGNLVEMVGR